MVDGVTITSGVTGWLVWSPSAAKAICGGKGRAAVIGGVGAPVPAPYGSPVRIEIPAELFCVFGGGDGVETTGLRTMFRSGLLGSIGEPFLGRDGEAWRFEKPL